MTGSQFIVLRSITSRAPPTMSFNGIPLHGMLIFVVLQSGLGLAGKSLRRPFSNALLIHYVAWVAVVSMRFRTQVLYFAGLVGAIERFLVPRVPCHVVVPHCQTRRCKRLGVHVVKNSIAPYSHGHRISHRSGACSY